MDREEQGRYLLKHRRNIFVTADIDKKLCIDRNQRHIERSLVAIVDRGWIYVDDFIKSMEEAIGTTDGVTLKKKGSRWSYAVPRYTKKEHDFITATILEKLFEAGFVTVGTHGDKKCFRVTPFGKSCLVK